jgi:DnaB helicase-like protein
VTEVQNSLKTYYAPEIEQALVSLVWQQPDLLGQLLQKLDPNVHISQPHLRILLETISYCYSQFNDCDWSSVIEALRQFQKLDECGGKVLLDQIYKNPGCKSLLGWYIEILIDYASYRVEDPPRPSTYFSGGKGKLWANKGKLKSSCDVVGQARLAGKPYSLRGWSATDPLAQKFIDLRFYPQ